MQRSELTATGARQLFAGASAHHPMNMMHGHGPAWVMRGGIRF